MNIEPAITERVFREGLIPNPKARLREQVREVMRYKHCALRPTETVLSTLANPVGPR